MATNGLSLFTLDRMARSTAEDEGCGREAPGVDAAAVGVGLADGLPPGGNNQASKLTTSPRPPMTVPKIVAMPLSLVGPSLGSCTRDTWLSCHPRREHGRGYVRPFHLESAGENHSVRKIRTWGQSGVLLSERCTLPGRRVAGGSLTPRLSEPGMKPLDSPGSHRSAVHAFGGPIMCQCTNSLGARVAMSARICRVQLRARRRRLYFLMAQRTRYSSMRS